MVNIRILEQFTIFRLGILKKFRKVRGSWVGVLKQFGIFRVGLLKQFQTVLVNILDF